MCTLKFERSQVMRILEHSQKCKTHRGVYGSDETKKPGLWWVKDEGIYLMSNGGRKSPVIVYAEGYSPYEHDEYYDLWTKCRDAVGGDDFVEFLPVEMFKGIPWRMISHLLLIVSADTFQVGYITRGRKR